MMPDQFLVKGNFHEGNFGDDALLVAVQLLLSKHSNRVVYDCECLAYTHDVASGLMVADQSSLFSSDYIVYGGGTQFFSFKSSATAEVTQPSVASRFLKLIFDPGRLVASVKARCRARKESELKRLAIGIGYGPFEDDLEEKKAAMDLAESMDFTWVRDDASEVFCREAGLDNYVRGADLCFSSEFLNYFRSDSPLILPANYSRPKKLGIIFRDWSHADISTSYATCMRVAQRCRALGWEVDFYVFSKGDKLTLKYLEESGEQPNVWDAATTSITEYSNQLASCDSILTQRFHGAVFAILLNIPFTVITLDPKLEMVGDLLGDDAKLSPQQSQEDYFMCVERTMREASEIKKELEAVLIEQQERSDSAAAALLEYLSAQSHG